MAILIVVRALSSAATFVKLTCLLTSAPDVWLGDEVGQLLAVAVGAHSLIEEVRDFVFWAAPWRVLEYFVGRHDVVLVALVAIVGVPARAAFFRFSFISRRL